MQRTGEERDAEKGGRRGAWRPARPLALLLAGVAALVLVLAGILVSNSISLGAATARADLEERLSALTGEPVFIDGASSFDLFPRPQITLSRVRIGLAEPSREYRVDIDHVQADLDLFDALIGRPVIDELTLIRPEALPVAAGTVATPLPAGEKLLPAPSAGARQAEPAGNYGALSGLAQMLFERFEGVRTLRIRDGVFRPREGDGGVSSANLDFSWPGRSASARLIGNYVWNGQPAEIDAAIASPRALDAGEPSKVSLQISSPSLTGAFEGTAELADMVELSGSLRLSTPSLARTVRWLGHSTTRVPEFGAFELTTEIHLFGPRVFLGDVRLGVGGFVGNGAMEAVLLPDGRPSIGGTLAFERLEFDRLANAIAPLPRHALDLDRPIALAFVKELDLDLRLSASEAVLASLPARQLAATVKLSDGVATLDVGDAEFLGGRVAARLIVDARQTRPTATARVSLEDARANDLAALMGIDGLEISGRTSLTGGFAGPVASWSEILRSNEVDARLVVANGEIDGVDPETFLAAGERPLALGSTAEPFAFQRLEAQLSTSGPRARIEALTMQMPEGDVEASGTLSLVSDRVEIGGVFRPENAEQASAGDQPFTPSQPSRFTIEGEWPHATVSVDAGIEPI